MTAGLSIHDLREVDTSEWKKGLIRWRCSCGASDNIDGGWKTLTAAKKEAAFYHTGHVLSEQY